MAKYACVQFYSMLAVREIGWEWHRDRFITDARHDAASKGYPPPPSGDPALQLTYWRWSGDEGMSEVAPEGDADYVRVLWRWEGPDDG